MNATVAWHDAECASYLADLPVWRELAAAAGGPVLDVGAGTGRVALDLAAGGHGVTALDVDAALLDELARRAAASGLEVRTVVADAEAMDLPAAAFATVVVPMQTIQLLGDRAAFLHGARHALRPGGTLAIAIADELTSFTSEDGILPDPDVLLADGRRYVSQPTAVRLGPSHSRIERIRITEGPDGALTSETNAIELAVLDAPGLAAEGRAAGFTSVPGLRIPPTDDHVGSAVVVFRG